MTQSSSTSHFAAGKSRSLLLAVAALALLALSGGLLLALPSSDPFAGIAVCRASSADPSAAAAAEGRYADREFMAENEIVMTPMMAAMAISPTGNVDRDFVAMMVAHHQGAIDMAVAELRHGRNEQLRRIAQEIIATQGQEIQAMRAAKLATYSAPRRMGPAAASGQGTVAFDNQSFPITGTTEGVR